jgi:acetyltransferase-like isoleucine patch superfamily enzyme
MRQQYITSPTAPAPHSQGGWGKTWPPTSSNPSQPPQAPPPHIQERVPKDYRDIPPITELTNQPPRSEYPMMPPIHELSRGQPSKPLYQQGPNQRPDYGSMPRLDMSDSQAQAHQMKAKMALEHSRAIAHRNSHYDDPEKDKMLRGEAYRPHDPVLTDERERCKLALYRFNNAGNPFTGFTPNEQRRLLRDLIQPSRPVAGSPSSTSSVATGSVAPDCLVEAPFSCQYGYNISIASQVHISEGCKIIDARPVSIGAKTWIGPGVTIQTTMPDPHFGQRKGKDSPWLARPITIGDMCWIGAGAVIMPGVHIQTGGYVAPNEVVKKDVLGFGPPAWRFD